MLSKWLLHRSMNNSSHLLSTYYALGSTYVVPKSCKVVIIIPILQMVE